MAHLHRVARDDRGNVIPDMQITVLLTGSDAKATLFANAALTQDKGNPFYTNSRGEYDFFVAAGTYDIRKEKFGYGVETEIGVDVGTGGGSGQTWRVAKPADITGALNGVNKTYTLPETPYLDTEVLFFKNGVVQLQASALSDAAPAAYVISGATITLTTAQAALNVADGDWIMAFYRTS